MCIYNINIEDLLLYVCAIMLREGNDTPLQYSCLEKPMDRGTWWAVVHGITKHRTWLSDFTFTVHFHALEKEMAAHSSVLAWRIPGMAEPGGPPSMGLHRVRHDWSDLAAAAAAAIMLKYTMIMKDYLLLLFVQILNYWELTQNMKHLFIYLFIV